MPTLSPVVAKVIQKVSRTAAGIVACRYHRVFSVHAGPGRQTQDFTLEVVYENGALVKARMLRYTIDGKSASQARISSTIHSYTHPKPGDIFEAPWRAPYAEDYRDVVQDTGTVGFTAIDRSYGHGDGRFTYNATYDVTSYTYSPTVMPQHATSGTVTGSIGEVLPGYWAMTHENQSYRGRYAIFAAAASVEITESDFQRFPTLAAAERFIASKPAEQSPTSAGAAAARRTAPPAAAASADIAAPGGGSTRSGRW